MNNSEILYIYDAQMCNPNGDPDEENRPRMDYATQTNLVSDVRLKRYIRDYLQSLGHALYVSKGDSGEVVNASRRIMQVLGKEKATKLAKNDLDTLLEKLVDIRLFGATIPIQREGQEKGQSIAFTGPVQFNWGYSLNRVYLLDSQTITSHFSSGEDRDQGTMGKDFRIKYSILAFHGVISSFNAKHTHLSETDVALLDKAMIKSIPLHATRSKIGQEPRLYLRVEYNSDDFILGDFRKWIICENADNKKDEEIFSAKDIILNLEKLVETLNLKRDHIAKCVIWQDKVINVRGKLDNLPKLIPLSMQE
ncbi:MAG TPA: type I-B CRISPR-associated protein Cas7/Csh2 [bacterium]|jgi:CRISPR-associated protein Csh2|nr:type I-B CRISPR-associated protein Cas7/Csh2 [bacterium]HNT67282.1 type I-B CRISPR-associated protein Cas7/Csh2 [bacterium]HOX86227.1 type I-B CRISPR-associated protein Cas7/Csh2 [bacterium]HPG45559.1 type I-B CRISPR-associated protein Cas7/Csh2 [bacterium]HPM97662.1 type I-B CRISPR-associated protein Cas7/Csh2 [bacterium]